MILKILTKITQSGKKIDFNPFALSNIKLCKNAISSRTSSASFRLSLISLIALSFPFFGIAAKAEEVLKLGLYDNQPGLFVDENGVPQGLFVDLLNEIAKREQWTLEYEEGEWSVLLQKLKDGEIDMLFPISYSQERDKVIDYVNEPVSIKWGAVYLAPDSDIKILPDLDGKRVAVLKGDIHGKNFRAISRDFDIQPEIIETSTDIGTFELIEKGEVDAAVVNSTFGYTQEEHYQVERSTIVFHPTRATFATPEGKHEEIRQTIDTYLKQWKQDKQSIYYESYNHWHGGKKYIKETVPQWVFILLAGGGGCGIVIFLWNRTLQNEIDRRKILEAQLQAAKEKAEVANQAKSTFLANMSHELRSPLNAILGFAQIMIRSQTLPREQQENVGIIVRSGEHLLTLINNVLDLSKIEAGKTTLNTKNFDLHRLLDDLHDMFQLKAEGKRLQFLLERDEELPRYICTDEVKLRQVLINLLNNAIKFTEEGGITLSVTSHQRCDSASAQDARERASKPVTSYQSTPNQQPTTIHLELEDTGAGISPEELKNLFVAFSQTQTGKQAREGTGLGLHISRQFVQLMGGEIKVSSQLGRGTTFRCEIRVKEVAAADIESQHSKRRAIALAPNQPRYRILIVDDKILNRQLLIKLLSPFGFELKEASNGGEAIAVFEEWQPHLIWMDMRMPVLDGYEATQKIKATTQGQATAIIALTASVLEEEKAVTLSAGCDDFMRKPFREEDIFAAMHEHLGVEYIYEEPTTLPPQTKTLTREEMAALPEVWQRELQEVILKGDREQMSSLLERISQEQADLAEILQQYLYNFEYEKILALLPQFAHS